MVLILLLFRTKGIMIALVVSCFRVSGGLLSNESFLDDQGNSSEITVKICVEICLAIC